MRVMKESGVSWIGEIPEGWCVEPLKQVYKFDKGLPITKADLIKEGLPVLSYGQIHSKRNTPLHIIPDLVRYVGYEYGSNTSSMAQKGDLLFADTSEDTEGIGNHSYVDFEEGIFAGYHTILARNQRNSDGRYFSLLLETDAWRSQLRKMASGIKVFSVTKRMLNGTSIIVPPDEEQSRIADFLDDKCSKIDAVIVKQEQIIEKLQGYKTAIITEATTHGLYIDVDRKTSSIGWIGDIPEHWSEFRIANLYNQTSEAGNENLPILTVSINTGISDRELSDEESDRVFVRSEDRSKYKRVQPGDLAYNMMRAWQGAFGAVRVEGMVSPAYVTCRPKETANIDSRYIEYLFRTPIAIEEMHRFSHGVADFRLRLYWPEFKNIRLCLPPIKEQKEIADYIDKKSGNIEKEITSRKLLIEKLAEYKKSLIYEVVTGKKEV